MTRHDNPRHRLAMKRLRQKRRRPNIAYLISMECGPRRQSPSRRISTRFGYPGLRPWVRRHADVYMYARSDGYQKCKFARVRRRALRRMRSGWSM